MERILSLGGLFGVTNGLGLFAALSLVPETEVQVSSGFGGLWLTVVVAVVGIAALLLLKYELELFLKIWLTFAFFFGIFLFFGTFFSIIIAVPIAIILSFLRYRISSIIWQNIILIFAFSGIGAYIGTILGFWPALILVLGLSVYDFISVKISKHMMTLAKESFHSNILLGFVYSSSKGTVEEMETEVEKDHQERDLGFVGGGDVIVPLIFSVSIFRSFGLAFAVASSICSLAALVVLLLFSEKGEGFWPAIPILGGGALVGLLLAFGFTLFGL